MFLHGKGVKQASQSVATPSLGAPALACKQENNIVIEYVTEEAIDILTTIINERHRQTIQRKPLISIITFNQLDDDGQ